MRDRRWRGSGGCKGVGCAERKPAASGGARLRGAGVYDVGVSTLDADLTCLNCGYNLRGVEEAGVCPECGIDIGTTLRRDRLSDAPLPWRRRLAWGARLWHWGSIVAVLGLPPGAVLAGVRLVWVASALHLTGIGAVLVVLGLYAGVVVAGVGLLMLTGKQPGRAEPRADRVRRVVTRLLVGAGLATLVPVLAVAAYLSMDLRSWASWSGLEYVDSSLIALHALLAIAMLSGWSHVWQLASRIPDPKLMRRCRWAQGLWLGALAVAGLPLLVASAGFYLGVPVTLEMEERWAQGTVVLLLVSAVCLWGVAVWSTAGISRGLRGLVEGGEGEDAGDQSITDAEADSRPLSLNAGADARR